MIINNNLKIVSALFKRDLKVIFKNFKSVIFDTFILMSLYILVFQKLLPTLGMSLNLAAPLFIGSLALIIISTGFSRAAYIKSDLEFKKYVNYIFALPINKKWIIFVYILASTVELIVMVLPAVLIGSIVIMYENLTIINLLLLILVYSTGAIFASIFYLFLVFKLKWDWFINNTWERILTPAIHLGAAFFTWHNLYNFSPFLGYLTLLNPLTYIIEGARSAIISDNNYLPWFLCIIILLIYSIIFLIPLYKAIYKKMDPV